MKMNKLVQMGIVGLIFSALTLIGHHCGWGVEGQRNAWLLSEKCAYAVSGFFAGGGSTMIIVGCKL